mmetsp:Transcript_114271/g.227387  ORF Transcript_114271/g.227387 Transcript_114271/m.227387 type:complete len:483 (+) Transcript_114271:420-1868(+)
MANWSSRSARMWSTASVVAYARCLWRQTSWLEAWTFRTSRSWYSSIYRRRLMFIHTALAALGGWDRSAVPFHTWAQRTRDLLTNLRIFWTSTDKRCLRSFDPISAEEEHKMEAVAAGQAAGTTSSTLSSTRVMKAGIVMPLASKKSAMCAQNALTYAETMCATVLLAWRNAARTGRMTAQGVVEVRIQTVETAVLELTTSMSSSNSSSSSSSCCCCNTNNSNALVCGAQLPQVVVAAEAVVRVLGTICLRALAAALVPNPLAQLACAALQMVGADGAVTGAKAGVVGALLPLTQHGAQYPPVEKAAVGVVLMVVTMADETGESRLQLVAASARETSSFSAKVELAAIGTLVTMPTRTMALPGEAKPGMDQGRVERVVAVDGHGIVVGLATALVGGVRAAAGSQAGMERYHERKQQVLGPSRAVQMMQVFAGLPKATDGNLRMELGLAAIEHHNAEPAGVAMAELAMIAEEVTPATRAAPGGE